MVNLPENGTASYFQFVFQSMCDDMLGHSTEEIKVTGVYLTGFKCT